MSDIIHLLPDSVANQIAAGEVIQRPASVLKELVENAIDAGASAIKIVFKDAGRTLMQVTDNGKGMSETDARMAFERHATSKIADASDLFTLRTLGFRGEALASIAAVAQVEMRSRRANDELGVMVEIAGTRVFKQELIQCDLGTSFLVKNLFFNVPARRRFLGSDNVEKRHILNEFYRIVLVYPQIEFCLYDGDEEIYNLAASNIKLRVENVFGKNSKKRWEQQLLPIETSTNLVNIYGFVGKPEYAQKSATQYFFVNGRFMQHPYFRKAVVLAYSQMIQASESPNFFIYLEVDPQSIDVNIHPTKVEIKFENEQAIWSILSAAVKEALGKFNISPSIDFDQDGALEMPVSKIPLENIRPPQTNFNPAYNPFSPKTYNRPSLDWEKLHGDFEQNNPTKSLDFYADSHLENTISSVPEKEIPAPLLIESIEVSQSEYFQLKNSFIITSIKSGMLMIDQHRAHYRILFDDFLSQIECGKSFSQQVLFPEEIELNSEDALVFDQIQSDLRNVGFDFDKAGSGRFAIKAVPSVLKTGSVIELLLSMIHTAKHTAINPTYAVNESIASALARVSALKRGQKLSPEEMANIVERVFACPNHSFTPDGKKIMTVFLQDRIEAEFN